MYFLRILFAAAMIFFISLSIVVAEEGPSWYAIVKVDSKKAKLYTKGDIFYSRADITDCLRIEDIRSDILVLKDVNSEKTIVVKVGEDIPLEGTDFTFEKVITQDVVMRR